MIYSQYTNIFKENSLYRSVMTKWNIGLSKYDQEKQIVLDKFNIKSDMKGQAEHMEEKFQL